MSEQQRRGAMRRTEASIGRIGGAWKVAYADLATAMMALFLVLWLSNQDSAVRRGVARYFQDPIAFDPRLEGGRSPLGDAGTGNGPIDGLLVAPRLPRATPARETLDRAALRLRKSLEALPSFQALGQHVELAVGDDGLRIDLVEQARSSFFTRGGRELTGEGAEIVRAIGRELAPLGHDVVLEGHTDSVPFHGEDGYSNWELSADRANSARRALLAGGVGPGQVKAVRGYADQKPRIQGAPADPRNRRIAILVSPGLPEAAARDGATPE